MPVDSREPRQEQLDKSLCLELAGVDEIELLELTICEPPEPSCGITYTLLPPIGQVQAKSKAVPTGQRSAK
jgi:hypothetical protein